MRSLLISDSISSIVHPEMEQNLPPDLAWLQSMGLWRGRRADELVASDDDYGREVLATVESFASRREFRFEKDRFPALADLQRIYIGKLDHSIETALLDSSLAKLGRYGGSITVHRAVSEAVISVTTRHLAASSRSFQTRVVPSTDDAYSLSVQLDPLPSLGSQGKAISQYLLLDGMVPTPSPETSMEDILSFRAQYRDDLERLRLALYEAIEAVSASDDPLSALETKRMEMEASVRRIKKAARSRRLYLTWGAFTVAGLAAGAPTFPINSPIWLSFGGLGTSVAAGLVATWIRNTMREPSPYSYLSLIDRRFGSTAAKSGPQA